MGSQEATHTSPHRSMARVLRRRLPLILVAAVLVPVSAVTWSVLQEKQYRAEASLLFCDKVLY